MYDIKNKMTGIELTSHEGKISVIKRPERSASILFIRSDTVSKVDFVGCDFDRDRKYVWYESPLDPGDCVQLTVKDIDRESEPVSTGGCFDVDAPPDDERAVRECELSNYRKLRNRLLKKGLIEKNESDEPEETTEKPKVGFELKTPESEIRAALTSGIVIILFYMNKSGTWLSCSGIDSDSGDRLTWYDKALQNGDRFEIRLTGMTESTPPIDIRPDPKDDESLLERFRQMEQNLKEKRYLK